jgi:biotin carboxyl carrier protein
LQYAIEVAGRWRQVNVARTGDRFAVSVDGRTYALDAVRIDGQLPVWLSLIVDSGVAAGPHRRNSYNVTITPAGEGGDVSGRFIVQVGATPAEVVIDPAGLGRSSKAAVAALGPERITTPMAGKLVRLLVRVGDAVRGRDPVAVVEAMKMENELRATRDGTVVELDTREGASVEAGALLMVIR